MRAPSPWYNPQQSIMNKLAQQQNLRENSSRLAHSFGSFTTVGWGEFAPEDAVMFDAPYLSRPIPTHCGSLSDDDQAAKLRTTRHPRATGMVTHWDVNPQGLYLGAWVIVWVEDRSPLVAPTDPDPDPDYTIVHDFSFLGIAIKSLPTHIQGDEGEV